jgi:hypothetical protein
VSIGWEVVEVEELGRLAELLERLEDGGAGVYVLPVWEGRSRGLVTDEVYGFDGFAVGWMTSSCGDEIAVGPTVAAAVEVALELIAAGAV